MGGVIKSCGGLNKKRGGGSIRIVWSGVGIARQTFGFSFKFKKDILLVWVAMEIPRVIHRIETLMESNGFPVEFNGKTLDLHWIPWGTSGLPLKSPRKYWSSTEIPKELDGLTLEGLPF